MSADKWGNSRNCGKSSRKVHIEQIRLVVLENYQVWIVDDPKGSEWIVIA